MGTLLVLLGLGLCFFFNLVLCCFFSVFLHFLSSLFFSFPFLFCCCCCCCYLVILFLFSWCFLRFPVPSFFVSRRLVDTVDVSWCFRVDGRPKPRVCGCSLRGRTPNTDDVFCAMLHLLYAIGSTVSCGYNVYVIRFPCSSCVMRCFPTLFWFCLFIVY